MLIHKTAVKQLVNEHKKRCSSDFLNALDRKVNELVIKACGVSNVNRRITVKGEDINGL